jgi:hypothetical protein
VVNGREVYYSRLDSGQFKGTDINGYPFYSSDKLSDMFIEHCNEFLKHFELSLEDFPNCKDFMVEKSYEEN